MNANSQPEARLREAFALARADRLPEAIELVAGVIASHPDHPLAYREMALLCSRTGQADRALQNMARAVALAPDSGPLRCELGRLRAGAGDFAGALADFEAAVGLDDGLVEGWFFVGVTLTRLQRDAEAVEPLRRAHALAPDAPEIIGALAHVEFKALNSEQALPLFRRLSEMRPDDEDCHLKLGETYSRLGKPAEAATVFRDALGRFPESPGLWMARAQAEDEAGDRAAAVAAYTRAAELAPEWPMPLAGLISLRGAELPEDVLARAETMVARTVEPDPDTAVVAYELGKLYDRRGEHAAAMTAWQRANAGLRRLTGPLDRAAVERRLENAVAGFTGAADGAGPGLDDDRPVFIVGMPRSGTTLIEQIVAAHPQVAGCGELADIPKIAAGFGDAVPDDPAVLRQAAQRWLRSAELHADEAGARRLVDKLPMNSFHLGLISRMFPRAHVIWCRRDPRDVAVSVFAENMSVQAAFATDLADIGFYHAMHERFMRFWQRTLALPIIEVRYEGLVADLEPEARRVVEFVGLDWDPACLEFHATARAVQTPSRWQVREPVHGRSVGRWRAYAEWLGPFEDALGAFTPG